MLLSRSRPDSPGHPRRGAERSVHGHLPRHYRDSRPRRPDFCGPVPAGHRTTATPRRASAAGCTHSSRAGRCPRLLQGRRRRNLEIQHDRPRPAQLLILPLTANTAIGGTGQGQGYSHRETARQANLGIAGYVARQHAGHIAAVTQSARAIERRGDDDLFEYHGPTLDTAAILPTLACAPRWRRCEEAPAAVSQVTATRSRRSSKASSRPPATAG